MITALLTLSAVFWAFAAIGTAADFHKKQVHWKGYMVVFVVFLLLSAAHYFAIAHINNGGTP